MTVAPVAPVVEYVILVTGVLIHSVCASVPAADTRVTVLLGVTVTVPVVVTVPQPPVNITVYGKLPDNVGVPLIVTTLPAHTPVTPAGKPVTVAPVAPVVEYVILVNGVLIHIVCASVPAADVLVTVLLGVIVTVTKTGAALQPLVKSLTSNWYVLVVAGVAIGLARVLSFSPGEGVQRYE